jgi:RNA polymerase sigma-70 factor (ECF subfamily)
MAADEPQPPDADLVARAQRGDTSAFDQLILRHSPRLYALVYHMTANREDTHDLLQEIFAKAYRSLNRFRGQSRFYTWIYTIAVNMTLNFLKKRNRRQTTLSLDDIDAGVERDADFIAATAPRTPEREADLKELQKKLNEAMMRLSDDHRAVVTMYDIQGLPHSEISRIMGVSEGTIRSRLFYAHRQLQTYLGEFWKR